jgi:hypothetical protein
MKRLKEFIAESKDYIGTKIPKDNVIKDLQRIEGDHDMHEKNLLDSSEHNALKVYIGSSDNHGKLHNNNWEMQFESINNYLRHGESKGGIKENIMPIIHHLDSGIAKHKLNHETHVWRGFLGLGTAEHDKKHEIEKMKPGDTFHDKGYTSTSLTPEYAKEFGTRYRSSLYRKGTMKHIAHITLPKGSEAIHPNSYPATGIGYEHEVLLPRNSKFKYIKKSRHPGLVVHHLEYMGQHEET